MTDRMKSYYYLKSKGICVRCEKEKALIGRVTCYTCSIKDAEKSRKYRENNREKARQRDMSRYKTRKDKGLCVRCGKVFSGTNLMCLECSLKKNRYEATRKKARGYIEPHIRIELGMCYYCTNKAIEGKKTCQEHYEKIARTIKNNRRNVDTNKHPFRDGNKVLFMNKTN